MVLTGTLPKNLSAPASGAPTIPPNGTDPPLAPGLPWRLGSAMRMALTLSKVCQFSVTQMCTTAAPREYPAILTCWPGQAARWSRTSRFSSLTPARALAPLGIVVGYPTCCWMLPVKPSFFHELPVPPTTIVYVPPHGAAVSAACAVDACATERPAVSRSPATAAVVLFTRIRFSPVWCLRLTTLAGADDMAMKRVAGPIPSAFHRCFLLSAADDRTARRKAHHGETRLIPHIHRTGSDGRCLGIDPRNDRIGLVRPHRPCSGAGRRPVRCLPLLRRPGRPGHSDRTVRSGRAVGHRRHHGRPAEPAARHEDGGLSGRVQDVLRADGHPDGEGPGAEPESRRDRHRHDHRGNQHEQLLAGRRPHQHRAVPAAGLVGHPGAASEPGLRHERLPRRHGTGVPGRLVEHRADR